LEGLGFIDVKSGPSGPISYILILNPYLVIKEHQSRGMVDPSSWHALVEKMIEIKATDLDPPPPTDLATPEAAVAAPPPPMTAAQDFGFPPPLAAPTTPKGVEIADLIVVNHVSGQKEDNGYKYLKELGLSVQGQNSNNAWKAIAHLAKSTGIKVEAGFYWSNHPKAARPNESGRLSA
jgi:hypothetical protein